jgi:hypothetical protein
LFEFPRSSTERAFLFRLGRQPFINALNMKSMRTDTPYYWSIITWEIGFRRVAIERGPANTAHIVTCRDKKNEQSLEGWGRAGEASN